MGISSSRAIGQRGITGLETAIILIAFVVVASVFAFTVLSTGIFASERSKETVFSGIKEAQSSIEPRGSVIAYRGYNASKTATVYKLTMVLSNAIAGESVDRQEPVPLRRAVECHVARQRRWRQHAGG